MITFACPTCSKTYSAPETSAGKRVKCRDCGEQISVPTSPESGWEVVPTPPAAPQKVETPRKVEGPFAEDPEPPAYRFAENSSSALLGVTRVVGGLGIIACLLTAVLVFVNSKAEMLGVLFLAAAAGWLVLIMATEVATRTVQVVVDLARNTRAVRQELAVRTRG